MTIFAVSVTEKHLKLTAFEHVHIQKLTALTSPFILSLRSLPNKFVE